MALANPSLGLWRCPTYQSTVRLMVSFPACPTRGSEGLWEGRGWCVTPAGCSWEKSTLCPSTHRSVITPTPARAELSLRTGPNWPMGNARGPGSHSDALNNGIVLTLWTLSDPDLPRLQMQLCSSVSIRLQKFESCCRHSYRCCCILVYTFNIGGLCLCCKDFKCCKKNKHCGSVRNSQTWLIIVTDKI